MIDRIKAWWYDYRASVYARRLGRLQNIRHLLTEGEYDLFCAPMWAKIGDFVWRSNAIKRKHLGNV